MSLKTLTNIEHITHKVLEKFDNMTKLVADSEKRLCRRRIASGSEDVGLRLEKEICGIDPSTYSLILTNDALPAVFKLKPVALRFNVVDADGLVVLLAKPTVFRLELWLSSSPTIRLEKSHKGTPLLSGCTEVSSFGDVEFRKFYVSEVSSHYINCSFTLVVRPLDLTIRPFVLKNFIVQARKPTRKEMQKRFKPA